MDNIYTLKNYHNDNKNNDGNETSEHSRKNFSKPRSLTDSSSAKIKINYEDNNNKNIDNDIDNEDMDKYSNDMNKFLELLTKMSQMSKNIQNSEELSKNNVKPRYLSDNNCTRTSKCALQCKCQE